MSSDIFESLRKKAEAGDVEAQKTLEAIFGAIDTANKAIEEKGLKDQFEDEIKNWPQKE